MSSTHLSVGTLRRVLTVSIAVVLFAALAGVAVARDRPHGAANLNAFLKLSRPANTFDSEGSGISGSKLSKKQIERFTCTSGGDPTDWVDISCNDAELGQDFAPDNEIAVAVNPNDPDHIVAGSNDYFYRFNNSTGARQAIVVTGFFTSFDGGESWLDGQIPVQSGNGAGDPVPAFVGALGVGPAEESVVLMAQLENVAGQGGCCVAQGHISVSRSDDGGRTWQPPVMVMKGQGAGIGPANQAKFWDKEWLTVDNNPASPFYGRAYLTATLFQNGLQGSYVSSAIYLSYSDDGGLTWSRPRDISGSHPSCTWQETGPAGACDENQFSIPEVAPNGTLYVHFHNYQNEAAFELPFDFDAQIMVVKSTDGGLTFSDPVPAVQLEDGLYDMPYSVIGRQTIWGHQIRWTAAGNISVNPNDPDDVVIVFADRGTPNPNAFVAANGLPCWADPTTVRAAREAGTWDPCNAGPGSDTDVYFVRSTDGGATWDQRTVLEDSNGHAWFPWADHRSDGTLAVAWDQDDGPGAADTFHHVLKLGAAGSTAVGPTEQPDISLTHWAGQYVPPSIWPTICGPASYPADQQGKDCNAFHGDYTGLAVGPDDSVHVVWTGLNVLTTSPQIDFYTGQPHDGYRQDAMYARR